MDLKKSQLISGLTQMESRTRSIVSCLSCLLLPGRVAGSKVLLVGKTICPCEKMYTLFKDVEFVQRCRICSRDCGDLREELESVQCRVEEQVVLAICCHLLPSTSTLLEIIIARAIFINTLFSKAENRRNEERNEDHREEGGFPNSRHITHTINVSKHHHHH